jgi:hypothetical protein
MNENDIDDRPDVNTGKEWSDMDLFDLANSVRLKTPVEEIATFLCRSRREVREKIAELDRSGNSPGASKKPPPTPSRNNDPLNT